MCALSQEALRITAELNNAYHTPEELRVIFSRLTGRPTDDTFTLFPPFYTEEVYKRQGLDRAHGYELYEKYRQYKLLTQELTEQANLRADGTFYRMGADFQRNFNEAIGCLLYTSSKLSYFQLS